MNRVSPSSSLNRPKGAFRRVNGFQALTFVVIIIVAFAVAYPVGRLFFEVFAGSEGATVKPFREAFSLPGIWTTIANTIIVVSGSTVLATTAATVFAWLNERTDARMGFIAEVLPLGPLLVPPIASAIGWVFLLSPRTGILNVLLRDVFGLFGIEITEGPVNLYSFAGLVILCAFIQMPYAYLPIAAAFSRLDPSLEEASRVHGMRAFSTFIRVTLPAVKPGLASAALIAVIIGLAEFSVPVIVGVGADIELLSVRIYRLMTVSFPPSTESAAALGVIMLAVVGAVSLLQRRILSTGAYATIRGGGARVGQVRLGRWRPIARLGMVAFLLTVSVLPFIALLYNSLRGYWSAELTLRGLNFDNYRSILLEMDVTQEALLNSVLLALGGGTVAMLIAALFAMYVGVDKRGSARLADGLAKLPGGFPHVVLAVALLAAFAGPPFSLYGSSLLLLIAYVILYLPQSYLTAGSAYNQISTSLGEASRTSGAGRARTFLKIELPLMLRGLSGGFAMMFVLIMAEVTASALLAGPTMPVIGFVILSLYSDGTFPAVGALATMVTLVTATVTLSVLYFGRSGGLSVRQKARGGLS